MGRSRPQTDRDILIREAYATDEHLVVRNRTHELYSRPRFDFREWVINTIAWRGDERVLDVGAGPGLYADAVSSHIPDGRYFAGDLSFGMAQRARERGIQAVNLDIQHLPFAASTFDVVLANHMLYHVPDLDLAFAELSRVLKPDGVLLAATRSVTSMSEFDTLARRACTLLGYPLHQFVPIHQDFTLENGPRKMSRYFRAVARYDVPGAFHFPAVAPVIAYLNSTKSMREPQLPEGITWDEFMDAIEKQVERLIEHYGELQVRKLEGVIVGTNAGGFAREYVRLLDSTIP